MERQTALGIKADKSVVFKSSEIHFFDVLRQPGILTTLALAISSASEKVHLCKASELAHSQPLNQ